MNTGMKAGKELRETLEDQGMSLPTNYVIKVWDTSAEFILVDEDGKRVFGGDIMVYGYYGRGEDRNIQLNKGSMGSFDLTCKASVESYLLMAHLIKNFKLFSETMCDTMDRVINQSI